MGEKLCSWVGKGFLDTKSKAQSTKRKKKKKYKMDLSKVKTFSKRYS